MTEKTQGIGKQTKICRDKKSQYRFVQLTLCANFLDFGAKIFWRGNGSSNHV